MLLTAAKALFDLRLVTCRQSVFDRQSQDRPHCYRGQDWQETTSSIPYNSRALDRARGVVPVLT